MTDYEELDYDGGRERSCYTPGRVYRYSGGFKHNDDTRYLLDKDLVLCICKTGDCCYSFRRLEKEGQTQDMHNQLPLKTLDVYFRLKEKVQLYGGMEEAFPKMETLPEFALVRVFDYGTVRIPLEHVLTDKELERFHKIRVLEAERNKLMLDTHFGEE